MSSPDPRPSDDAARPLELPSDEVTSPPSADDDTSVRRRPVVPPAVFKYGGQDSDASEHPGRGVPPPVFSGPTTDEPLDPSLQRDVPSEAEGSDSGGGEDHHMERRAPQRPVSADSDGSDGESSDGDSGTSGESNVAAESESSQGDDAGERAVARAEGGTGSLLFGPGTHDNLVDAFDSGTEAQREEIRTRIKAIMPDPSIFATATAELESMTKEHAVELIKRIYGEDEAWRKQPEELENMVYATFAQAAADKQERETTVQGTVRPSEGTAESGSPERMSLVYEAFTTANPDTRARIVAAQKQQYPHPEDFVKFLAGGSTSQEEAMELVTAIYGDARSPDVLSQIVSTAYEFPLEKALSGAQTDQERRDIAHEFVNQHQAEIDKLIDDAPGAMTGDEAAKDGWLARFSEVFQKDSFQTIMKITGGSLFGLILLSCFFFMIHGGSGNN